ncbi:MAG TPA: hypothetical protein VMZ26_17975 [Pyrinomonadaceae bacterium]|nr:hypothetical protein [Pyrinomonadaceae bacterium]
MKLSIFITFVLGLGIAIAGCGTTTTTNVSNANVSSANANSVPPAANTGLETVKKPEAPTTNDAPTLAPVVQKYYEALRKKDDALLRTVVTQNFIKAQEAEMKADKRTGSVVAYMAEIESMPDKPVEVRNEKIEGNEAVAELKGGAYLVWTPLSFINEGGKWKFTGDSPDLKSPK